MDWNETSVEGQRRFLARVYRFVTRNGVTEPRRGAPSGPSGLNNADRQALRKLHQTIRKITTDFDSRWHFNTSIASLMELTNELYQLEPELSDAPVGEICENLTLMLAPFAPYTAQELWKDLGHDGPVFRHPWPGFDPDLAKEETAEIPVQVNGKLRGHIRVPLDTAREEMTRLALANDKVKAFLEGRQVVKTIVVPDRLVNIVVK